MKDIMTTQTKVIRGESAIQYAMNSEYEEPLMCAANEVDGDERRVSIEEAVQIAKEDISLIWLSVEVES